MFDFPSFLGQHPQKGPKRGLRRPQHAEDWFFEGPAYTSEIKGALPAYKGQLTGDEPRQLYDPENTVRRALIDHGGSCGTLWDLIRNLAHAPVRVARAAQVKPSVPQLAERTLVGGELLTERELI